MIIFYHIPKTAGRSIIKSFSEKYNYAIFHGNHCEDVSFKNNLNMGLQFISYHGILPPTQFDNNFYFTFIRNPINMFVSYYVYNKYKLYVDNPEYIINENDFSMKSIFLCENINEYLKILLEKEYYIFPKHQFDYLNLYNFVGITERMEESIIKLENILNIKLNIKYENKISDIKLSEEQLKIIELSIENLNILNTIFKKELYIYDKINENFNSNTMS